MTSSPAAKAPGPVTSRLAALMPVAVNALVIGLMLYFVYGLHPYISILTVGAGQAAVCFALGVPMVKFIRGMGVTLE